MKIISEVRLHNIFFKTFTSFLQEHGSLTESFSTGRKNKNVIVPNFSWFCPFDIYFKDTGSFHPPSVGWYAEHNPH